MSNLLPIGTVVRVTGRLAELLDKSTSASSAPYTVTVSGYDPGRTKYNLNVRCTDEKYKFGTWALPGEVEEIEEGARP